MTRVEIVYLLLFVSVTVIRKYFTAKFKPEKEQLKQSSSADRLFLGLMGITMLLPVLKIWIDLFPWANYPSNAGLQWLGNLVFLLGIYMLYRSHGDLGRNWNPEVAINAEQNLIQSGVYKRIRHPMYSAHILWAIANTFVFANWIVAPAMLFILILFLPQRINREEAILKDRFGQQYLDYIKTTNSLIPKF